MKFKHTRGFKRHMAEEISRALMSLVEPPDMDVLDLQEILFDNNTTIAYKLKNWYEDQLLEWFDRINKTVSKYEIILPRSKDVRRLMSGMSIQEVCRLFIDEYEQTGRIER